MGGISKNKSTSLWTLSKTRDLENFAVMVVVVLAVVVYFGETKRVE